MAKVDLSGFDELDAAFMRIGDLPKSLKEDALQAMAAVAARKIKSQGEAMGVRDPDSDVHILDNIKVNKPELTPAGGYADITFSGTRTRNGVKTRNAEIAFVNEYGRRGQLARPFIGTAMSQNEDAIAKPGAELIGDWIESEFKK